MFSWTSRYLFALFMRIDDINSLFMRKKRKYINNVCVIYTIPTNLQNKKNIIMSNFFKNKITVFRLLVRINVYSRNINLMFSLLLKWGNRCFKITWNSKINSSFIYCRKNELTKCYMCRYQMSESVYQYRAPICCMFPLILNLRYIHKVQSIKVM